MNRRRPLRLYAASALVVSALGAAEASAADTKCVASPGFAAVARDRDGSVGGDVIVRRARDTKVKGICAIKPAKGDYVVLPKADDSTFLAFLFERRRNGEPDGDGPETPMICKDATCRFGPKKRQNAEIAFGDRLFQQPAKASLEAIDRLSSALSEPMVDGDFHPRRRPSSAKLSPVARQRAQAQR